MTFSGLFNLETPQDLFRKLEHDFRRIESDRMDAYAAFDLLITAEHLVDWRFLKIRRAAGTSATSRCLHLVLIWRTAQSTFGRQRRVFDESAKLLGLLKRIPNGQE